MIPHSAFILAAGFGKRMRPHTEDKPKPLVEVHGKSMLDHALDKLSRIGVKRCVVNTHYLGEKIAEHTQTRSDPAVILSHEDEILDTGGGIKNAVQHFDAPFFILSGDSVWEDAPDQDSLEMLAEGWDGEKMDILLLLQPVESMVLTKGVGDYDIDDQGRAVRSLDQSGRYMWTSIRINTPDIFDDAPDAPFSYLQLLDEAQAKGRLFACVHRGVWHHISTPSDLDAVNSKTSAGQHAA